MPSKLPIALKDPLIRFSEYKIRALCPSWASWRHSARASCHVSPAIRRGWIRSTSTLASSTAVNASKTIPPRLQELHIALVDAKSKASNYLNLSRLQLALLGLESEKPVERVAGMQSQFARVSRLVAPRTDKLAVLGLDTSLAARKLVKLLLVDPLIPEAEWERWLDTHDGRGFLIRCIFCQIYSLDHSDK